MTIHEVSERQYTAIEKFFDRYVFRREQDGKFWVKITDTQKKIIKRHLNIELK